MIAAFSDMAGQSAQQRRRFLFSNVDADPTNLTTYLLESSCLRLVGILPDGNHTRHAWQLRCHSFSFSPALPHTA
jgi:hypothetical protein